MSFFKRDKKKKMQSPAKSDLDPASKDQIPRPTRESAPQRVDVVSGVLTTTATSEEESSGTGIVDRHFGPNGKPHRRHEHLRAVEVLPGESLAGEDLESLKLEIDPMAHIGHATTITGNIVAEEDLEVQGTIEGAIRLANHQLTVGKDGHAKASVDAHTVLVMGRISGNVIASNLIEIKSGGIIGGDVKAPRIIMHDGGIVVGGMDMSASLPSSADLSKPETLMPERPKLKSVESPRRSSTDAEEQK